MEASEKRREGSAMDQEGGTESGTIDSVLAHNRAFVAGGEFARYATDKYPDKKLAVVSCMDTRLTELLAAALGLKNGDAKIIKVAGAEVAHTNCGAQHMSGAAMIDSMRRLGVSDERIEFARHCGIDFDRWLAGFGDTEESVRKSVDLIRNHPVMPPHVRVIGFIMDSDTGKLSVVC